MMLDAHLVRIALAVALLCTLGGVCAAKTFKLGDGRPVAEITVPDSWEAEANDGGLEATTSDAYVSGEVFAKADAAETGASVGQFLAERKIKLKPESRAQKATQIAGLTAVETSWDGTDEDGPTRVRVDVVKVSDDNYLLFTYWRSESGEKAHGAEVESMLASLKPIK